MRISIQKAVPAFLLLLYLCVLLRITVFRSNFSLTGLFAGGSLQWVPFYNLYLAFINQGLFYFLYLFLGNIIWFMPLGFLLPVLSGAGPRLPKLLLAGFCLSFLIELLQYVFGTGVSEVDDLLLNTIGTAAGYFLYRLMVRLKNAARYSLSMYTPFPVILLRFPQAF